VAKLFLALLAVSILVVASPAAAESTPSPPTESVWYGWQTLVSDGISLELAVIGAAASSGAPRYALVGAGAAGFVLGPPVIHLAHGHWDKALGSLALRALPAILLARGFTTYSDGCAGDCNGPSSTSVPFLVAGIATAALVPWIDSLVIAREDAPIRAASFTVVPITIRNGAGVFLRVVAF
jgi:hypothetical protein